MNVLKIIVLSILLIGYLLLSTEDNNLKQIKQNGIIFSHESGHYDSTFFVKLKPLNKEGKIIYTLDGSLPKEGSKSTFVYQKPILLKKIYVDSNDLSFIPTTVIPEIPNYETWLSPRNSSIKGNVLRAKLILPDGTKKDVVTKTYFIDGLKLNLPEIYLTIDSAALFDYDTGIYVPGVHQKPEKKYTGNFFMRGKEWERSAHMAFLSIQKKIEIDQNIGVRIHGMASPAAPLKTLRLCARKKYGKSKFKFNPFELRQLKSYKQLLLRTPYSTWNKRFFADQLGQYFIDDLNLEFAASVPVTLYINGEYWGILDLAERMDKHYFKSHFNVEQDSLCYSEAAYKTVVGIGEDFESVFNFARDNDLSDPKNYNEISKQIDIDNLIDYTVVETYLGNWDWPGNNNERWRKGVNGKWRWVIVDLDGILLNKEFPMLKKLLDTTEMKTEHRLNTTLLYRRLIKNDEFKMNLVKRFEELMSTTLCPERLLKIIEKYEQIYKDDIHRQIDRWSLPQSLEIYKNKNEKMKDFIQERTKYMIIDIEEQLGVKINPVCQ